VCETERLPCTFHRNLTPSIEASLRAQPPIPRGADFRLPCVLVSWSGPGHPENGTHTRTVILSEAKNPDQDGQGCHGLRELFSAVTRAVGSALDPPLLFQEKGPGDELRGLTHKHFRMWIEKSSKLRWGVTAHAMTQTERRVCSCCYFLWKKVTKELCEILTHDALSTPRAESFGGVNEGQSHHMLHVHRNFTPSSASALRTPPKISRGAGSVLPCVLVSWSGPRHPET
jgi:hypothetical protein